MYEATARVDGPDGRLEIQSLERMEADTVLGWIADYLIKEKRYGGQWSDIEQRAKRSGKNTYELICEIEGLMTWQDLLAVFTSHINIPEATAIEGRILAIESQRVIISSCDDSPAENARSLYFWHPIAIKSALNKIGERDSVYLITKDLFTRVSDYSSFDNAAQAEKKDFSKDVMQILSDITKKAIQLGITDVHLYPVVEKDIYKLRYRILGELVDAETYSLQQGKSLLTVIINQAKEHTPSLKVDEVRRPLDGKIIIPKEDVGWHYDVDLRVSVMWKPDMTNADIVLRVLAKSDISSNTIKHLGFYPDHVEKLETAISRTRGIILVTGATGTGKSKTVNTLLASLPNTKHIQTIEDPIEYLLPNGRQFQIFEYEEDSAGNKREPVGFVELARQCKRHDPDIIFIGELRDAQTVQTAMHLSKTGHLVLATLHVARATMIPQALVEDYGVSVDTIADNLLLGVNQVLAKKLCPKCKQPYVLNEIPEWVRNLRFPNLDQVERLRGKIIYEPGYQPGCSCHMRVGSEVLTGYSGRTVIGEVYNFNPRDFESGKLSSFAMEEILDPSMNILTDAVNKIEAGEVGFEVLRSLM